MKCNKCGEYRMTVGELRACSICTSDGTTAQVRATVGDDAPLANVVAVGTGLAHRFEFGDRPERRRQAKAIVQAPKKKLATRTVARRVAFVMATAMKKKVKAVQPKRPAKKK